MKIRNCRALPGTAVFLQHGDVKDKRLFLKNDVWNAETVFEPESTTFTRSGNRMRE